jgi:hypothetical protein
VAKSVRGAAHRLDPPRVSESHSGPERKAPPPHPSSLLRVLSSGSHAYLARQGCARRQASRAPRRGQDRGDSRSRWPTSSLRPLGGVIQFRRSSPPSNERYVHSACALAILHRGSGVTVQGDGSRMPVTLPSTSLEILGQSADSGSRRSKTESDEVLAKDRLRRPRPPRRPSLDLSKIFPILRSDIESDRPNIS